MSRLQPRWSRGTNVRSQRRGDAACERSRRFGGSRDLWEGRNPAWPALTSTLDPHIFAVVGKGEVHFAYIYNIGVAQSFRRRGHAKAALLWLEQFVRAQGIADVRLNVFAHNSSAQVLYRSLGFECTSMMMRKALSADGA